MSSAEGYQAPQLKVEDVQRSINSLQEGFLPIFPVNYVQELVRRSGEDMTEFPQTMIEHLRTRVQEICGYLMVPEDIEKPPYPTSLDTSEKIAAAMVIVAIFSPSVPTTDELPHEQATLPTLPGKVIGYASKGDDGSILFTLLRVYSDGEPYSVLSAVTLSKREFKQENLAEVQERITSETEQITIGRGLATGYDAGVYANKEDRIYAIADHQVKPSIHPVS